MYDGRPAQLLSASLSNVMARMSPEWACGSEDSEECIDSLVTSCGQSVIGNVGIPHPDKRHDKSVSAPLHHMPRPPFKNLRPGSQATSRVVGPHRKDIFQTLLGFVTMTNGEGLLSLYREIPKP